MFIEPFGLIKGIRDALNDPNRPVLVEIENVDQASGAGTP
jgi:hypothetical protein